MNPNVKFVLDLAVGLAPMLIAIVATTWHFTAKLRDNTQAVLELAGKIDGTVISIGLTARVRELEDWKLQQETIAKMAERDSG